MRFHSSRTTVLVAFALAVGVAGCASTGGATERPAGSSANRIVAAELAPLGQLDALQAVQRLRVRWLQSRGGLSGDASIVLYVDGARRGGPEDLRFYQAADLEQLEFLSASDATTRYGTGHTRGAILVTTRN